MNRLWILLVSGILWALMMWLLFEREIVPYFEYQSAPSYRTLLRTRLEPEYRRVSVHYLSNKVGDMETLVRPASLGEWVTETRLRMNLSVDDREAHVLYASRTTIDGDYRVKTVHGILDMEWLRFTLMGTRRGEFLDMSYLSPLGKGTKSIRVNDDEMIGDSFTPVLAGGRLKPGKKWRIPMMDVMGFARSGGSKLGAEDGEKSFAFADVGDPENLRWQGRDVAVFPVYIKQSATSELNLYTVYVDEEGTVLSTKYSIEKNKEYEFRLEEKRKLTAEEAKEWKWAVAPPRGWHR